VTDSGYIVTANHIVADADRISVVSTDGQSYNATVAVADKVNDIAVLSIGPEFPRAGGLQLASATARPAASVLALGYPLPDIMGSTLKVTTGTISSVYGFRNDPRTYQFSAQIQSGNSGGPLLNLQGEVIGVVTAKLNAATVFEWTGDLPDSVSYAVKSAYLQPLLDSLLQIVTNTRPPAADKSPEEVAELAAPFVVMVIATPPR
jgi:S1-C subfamily serine protease